MADPRVTARSPENLFSISFGDVKVVMEMGCVQDACFGVEFPEKKIETREAQRASQASNSSQALFPTYLECGEDSDGSQFRDFR